MTWIDTQRLGALAQRPDAIGFATSQLDSSGVVAGTVLLNADAVLPVGFDDRRSWGGLLMHELGHLIGLPHSAHRSEVMFPDSIPGPLRWGPTDLAQLREAGRRVGCSPSTPS